MPEEAAAHLRPRPEIKLNEVIKDDDIDTKSLQLGFGNQRKCEMSIFEEVLKRSMPVLEAEPNVLQLDKGITKIVGPVRGQYFDLLNILTRVGKPQKTTDDDVKLTAETPFKNIYTDQITISEGERILFLGDMIDGGPSSIEVLLLLLSLKLRFPKQVFLLRGRRESRFEWDEKGHSILLSEQLRKWFGEGNGIRLFEVTCRLFSVLPVAAVVDQKYWCASGGIGPGLTSPSSLSTLKRTAPDATTTGLISDVIWSDPMEDEDEEVQTTALFLHNYEKGISYTYSFNAVMQFLHSNNYHSIIRGVSFTDNRDMPLQVTKQSHNSCGRPWHYQYSCYDPGYRAHKRSPTKNFPVTLSLFSAPRFLSENENKGAIIIVDGSRIDIKQFTAACRPFVLPKLANALSWSLPVVSYKAASVAAALWDVVNPTHDDPLRRLNEKMRVCCHSLFYEECVWFPIGRIKEKKRIKN
eukprot:TRINITY_DN1252_c1_g1_i1.p1 TRINITY_DN1252_c1_g1~~TRINITY_DN1252_c1_g1_i1.p1  ORF type:complete len:467 (+),score=92.47 TRINITY_DN1252_c1_g1_i1:55-1455(+)